MLTYKIHLFRHGITRANLEGKYVGLSDYPLCQEGIDALKEFVKDKDYPPVEKSTPPLCAAAGKPHTSSTPATKPLTCRS